MISFRASQNGSAASQEARQAKFAHTLKALNEQFLQWVQQQDKDEVWIDGVEDYLAHAKSLLSKYDDVLHQKPDEKSSVPASTAAAGPSSSAPAFSKPETKAPFGFQFSSGAAESAPTTSFNFAPAAASNAGFGGFSFGTGATAVKAVENKDEDEEDVEEEADNGEPSVALESVDADILIKQRVTLNTLDTGTRKWKSRGPGTLTVRQAKEPGPSGTRGTYVVFTTDTGRVLVNAPLVKGLKPVTNPKTPNNLIMILISRVDADAEEERATQLFKCASSEAMQELLAKINEFV